MDTLLNGFYKSKENTVCLLAWYCMRASKTFFTEYYGAENFTWLESVMSRTIGSTMVYRGETLECSKWEKEEGIRSRFLRLCRKLTLLNRHLLSLSFPMTHFYSYFHSQVEKRQNQWLRNLRN